MSNQNDLDDIEKQILAVKDWLDDLAERLIRHHGRVGASAVMASRTQLGAALIDVRNLKKLNQS